MFPSGYFYIISHKHKFAIDVYDGQIKEDANIILWPQKFEDSDNQLWTYDQGYLVNKKSGHVLDIRTSIFRKDKVIVQNKRKPDQPTQLWSFDQGFICSQIYPSMVFSIKNSSEKGGAQLILFNRKDSDNLEQQWYPETYNTFEKSLVTAATAGQLHKKEGFGQPRLGYGAEIGVPPELKVLPANTNIAGLGANIDSNPAPTPTQDVGSYNPSMPENLQGFYPPPTPSQVPTGPPPQADPLAAYPPPLPSSSSYPLPQVLATHHQQHYQKYSGEYTSPSYPPPPPTIPQQNHQNYQGYQGGGAYPPSVGYPPHPSQSSSSPRYPSPPNYPPVPNTHSSNPGGFYRPPTEMPLQGQYLPHGSNSQPPTDPYGYGSPNNNYPPPPRQNSYGGYPSQ